MEKYILLVLSVITALTAVALCIYGGYADRLYLCGEGVMYGIISLVLSNNYKEAKQRESDGI